MQADLLAATGLDAIMECAERLGGPHILVNNAGGWATRLGAGAVVTIASSAGRETSRYSSPEYAAAKAALIRFTSSWTMP